MSEVIKYLGAYLNMRLSMKTHTTNKCRMAMLTLLKIRNIRKILTGDACKTLVQGLVTSHLGYCNSIILELPDSTIKKFQRIQNVASKIILSRSKDDRARECMRELHWLPARSRIKHRILTLVHKSINRKAPRYLQELLEEHFPNRKNLRSSRNSNT